MKHRRLRGRARRAAAAAQRYRLARPHRFPATSCSNCGRDLGPGNCGTSHCEQHARVN